MPRRPRLVLPGVPLHLVQRGVDRQPCFVDDRDRIAYLADLREIATELACAVHAYVLMTNHVHLLLTPSDAAGPARLMNRLGRRHVGRFNHHRERTGTLWEGRYRSCLVADEAHVLACYRYIELNPMRAGMVMQPFEYRWSSHRENATGAPRWPLTMHPVFEALGADAAARSRAYGALFAEALPVETIDRLRIATRANTVFGTPAAYDAIATQLGRRIMPLPPGRPRRKETDPA